MQSIGIRLLKRLHITRWRAPFHAQRHNYACAENGLPPCLCARFDSLGTQRIAGFRLKT